MPPSQREIAALYERYGFLLRRRCLLLLRDEALADDALQDAFVRLLRSDEGAGLGDRPLRLLYRVVDTTCFDHLRRRRVRRVEEPSPDDPVGSHPDVPLEIRDAALRLLDSLADPDRRIAVLAFVDGLTQGEIAEEVGLSRVTVNKRVESLRARAATLFRAPAAPSPEGPPA
ncbi:MAG TPA: sigma-70 family RNA polymerase sigma factor [Polyangiaceae bacterium]|nr:sigma-70 family RNA polymerase sigma factor [Polyangiaceae bacterium]